jgi:hypothetical protein
MQVESEIKLIRKGLVVIEVAVEGEKYEVEITHRCVKTAPLEIKVKEQNGEFAIIGAIKLDTPNLALCLFCNVEVINEALEEFEEIEKELKEIALLSILTYLQRKLKKEVKK